jgi:lysophospholipase L1-like esterase
MEVLCIGDSLTFGSVGYSYIKYLKPGLKAINKGINGETTLGAYKRLQKYIIDSRYLAIRTYIIFIGINDIFLPYLGTLSPMWKLQMRPRINFKKCISDNDVFAVSYEKILQLLDKHDKNAIVVGLPLLQLEKIPFNKILARNAVIKEMAEKYDRPYVDTYSLQKSVLKGSPRLYSWGITNIPRILEEIAMLVFPFSKDMFSRMRHLELTVDGVHFNSLSAKIVAGEINKYLLTYE